MNWEKGVAMRIDSLSIGGSGYVNEDRLVVHELPMSGVVAVLADGMGGLSLGDMAADVVSQSIYKYLAENYFGAGECEVLHNALAYSDKELRNVSVENKSSMGAAVAVAIVRDKQLHCSWQGNVRVYVCHQGEPKLLTTDHIADIGYGRTALTRCIKGAGLRDDVPYICQPLTSGDIVIICTDGLYKNALAHLGKLQTDEMLKLIGTPEDDSSIIQITIE